MKKFFFFFILVIVVMVLIPVLNSQTKKDLENYNFPIIPSPYQTDNPYSVVRTDFTVLTRDGISLDATKFFPTEPNPYWPNGYPIVVMCHGYGGSKEEQNGFAQAQSTYGYVVYTYSMRGQGNSGGLSNLISKTEAYDLMDFINFVKHDHVGGDTSNIIVQGGSQGGTIPLMAASMGMKVKAIISALTSPEFATSWIENGSIKMTFLWTIEYEPYEVRYTPLVDRMSDWVYSKSRDKWDSLAYYLPIDRDFMDIIGNNTIPVMVENSWQDRFFNAHHAIKAIPLSVSPNRYYFGAVIGHGGDDSPTETTWHMNFWNEFYFYWLWGINNNILTRPKYHFAYTTFPVRSGMWSFVHDSSAVWPPTGMTNLKLYFNEYKKLSPNPSANSESFVTINNTVKANFTMEDAVNEEFTGTYFNNNFKSSRIVFDSDPLLTDVKMVGAPEVKLDYSSTASVCQLNFQIYEVRSNGTAKFINRINYTDRYYTANQRKTQTVNGQAHAHIFKAGSKIRVVVTNLDKIANDPFLGTNPFVLPVLASGKHKFFTGSNSFINLPVKSVGGNNAMLPPPEEIGQNLPKLEQNYPNPFNPSTRIGFTIPTGQVLPVTLKIYDIAGREVANLVQDNFQGGYYEVEWDATNFASGTYFYKLVSGSKIEVKRMLLIK